MITESAIAEIAVEVWDTMLGLEIRMTGPGASRVRQPAVTASVNVVGASDCVVTLGTTAAGARAVAAAMFAAEAADLSDEEVWDALGELTNMVGGNIKSLLAEPSRLSLPVVHHGAAADLGGSGREPINAVTLRTAGEPVVIALWPYLIPSTPASVLQEKNPS